MNQEVIKQIIQEQRSIRLPKHFVERDIWQVFKPLRQNNQIIVIQGMRRCGKSTFMQWVRKQEVDPHYYFNFDDDRLIEFTVADFQALLELLIAEIGSAKTAYFDEIQNIEGWERFVRRLHDQGYKIYLTSSNARLFSRELGTHLTGRTISIEIYPYSFSEFLRAKEVDVVKKSALTTENKGKLKRLFDEYVRVGGIPDYVCFEQPKYLSELYESILYRDIIVRNGVVKEHALKTLVYYLASNTGKEMSYNKLKQHLKLASATTVSEYCYFLTTSYLCFLVNQYSPSLKAQTHYAKKVYFIDHALAQTVGFHFSQDYGCLLENIVFIELKRRHQEIYFSKGNRECDFIVKTSHKVTHAIQVSAHLDRAETKQREFEGLREAMQTHKLKQGLILTDNTEYQEESVRVIPIWRWLLG